MALILIRLAMTIMVIPTMYKNIVTLLLCKDIIAEQVQVGINQVQKVGNSTFTNGTSASGNSWNSTTNKIGNSTFTTGTDSDGNYFSSSCNEYGCN